MMKKRIFIILIVLIAFISTGVSATDVSGDVWGEWTSAGNPYNVVGDLRVPPGSSLVIGPGCYVEFQGYYQLLVDSSSILQINGTETDSVVITTSETVTYWDGMLFTDSDSGSHINYSRIERAHGDDHSDGGAVQCYYSYLEIRNSLFQNNSGFGGVAYLGGNHYIAIENNFITDNDGNSAIIAAWDSYLSISGNIFTHNDSMNIIQAGDSQGTSRIADNIFYDNNNSAIMLVEGGGIIIENNIIYNNTGVVFWCWLISWQTIFRRNIVYNNHCPWFMCGGIFLSEESNYLVENNTICNNSGVYGSYLANIYEEHGAHHPVEFKNNVLWGNSFRNSQDSLILLTEVIFSLIYCDIQGGWDGIGNIIADPMFVDSASGDFHLLPGSPCIDAGDPASPYDPDGTIADMGALYFDQTTGIKLPDMLPREITLHQNYPNPFNAGTIIRFELPDESQASIDVYDILGRRVSSIIGGYYQPGTHEVAWDGVSRNGKRLPSGIYLYKLKSNTFEQTRRMMLLK